MNDRKEEKKKEWDMFDWHPSFLINFKTKNVTGGYEYKINEIKKRNKRIEFFTFGFGPFPIPSNRFKHM